MLALVAAQPGGADERENGASDAPATAAVQAAPANGATAASPASPAAAAPAPPPAPAIPAKYLVPAKQLFGSVKTAAPLAARSIGSYSRGCLAGAAALPVDGPNWQAMRLSRNRNWGHPELVALIERFADEAWRYEGWQGLLVGDISQPRGGPMLTGHASHQIGLDADIWLTPMPDRRLSAKERETLEATSMLAADEISVNPQVWTPAHAKIIKRVASYDSVERVLVHPAIKKALCESPDTDRTWLNKVRPYFGHYYHFHVRLACPAGVQGCSAQAPVPGDDGCGKELADWIKRVTPKPPEPKLPGQPELAKKEKPSPPVTLAQLPQECRAVLDTGQPGIPADLLTAQRKADALMAQAAAKAALEHAAALKQKHATKSNAAAPAATAKPDAGTTAAVPAPAASKPIAPTGAAAEVR